MVELLYGAKNFSVIADKETRAGRAVAFRFTGWRRPWVYRALAIYAEHDRASRTGAAPRKLSLALAWRVLFALSLFGLVHQARSNGLGLLVRDTGTSLEVRLEPSNSTPHPDARASAALNETPSARAGERGR